MAIIVTLFSLVAMAVGGLTGKAAQRSTEAMMRRIQAYLDDYKDLTGYYPPDGIDTPVSNDQGTPIRGSACLHYFLCVKPIPVTEIRAGKKFVREIPPIAKFAEGELSLVDSSFPGAREVLDGWKNPLHYDNTEDGEFRPQRGDLHIPPVPDDEHPVDPRTEEYKVGNQKAVSVEGIQGNGFDLWSYGSQEHEAKVLKHMPIASWNLKEE